MFTNWLTYRAVAEALDTRLQDAVIREAFTQHKNELVLTLGIGETEVFLQFSAEPRGAYLLLKSEYGRARRNSLDLLPDIIGDSIRRVRIAVMDRIIRFDLASGRSLFAFLFPVRANFMLMHADGTVLESFKQHDPPANAMVLAYDNTAPLFAEEDVHRVLTESSERSVAEALRSLRPWISGTFAVEVLLRAHIEAGSDACSLCDEDTSRLTATLAAALMESAQGSCYAYLDEHTTRVVSLLALTSKAADEQQYFEDVLEGLFFFVRKRFSGTEFHSLQKRVLVQLAREMQRLEKTLSLLSSPAALKKQAAECEKFGNLLMIHLYDHPEQPGRMTVPDIFTDPRLVITIPLKGRTTVLENAQRYFRKAQQVKASISHVEDRSRELTERRERLAVFHKAVSATQLSHELKSLFKENAALMEDLGLTPKGEKNESPFPFRRFVVAGGFEVWAGRNSANNDLLTVRHSRPNDLWFHARGVGGSHVVLKVGSAAGDPSKEAIRQAASIAAYYSKHRNAKHVPVAYTEKKYVRKPRGASPGSVLVEREKVIMADPALPEEI